MLHVSFSLDLQNDFIQLQLPFFSRNITIRDPSPTLLDNFHHNTSTTKTSTKNKKPPFPSKAQVHSRPTDGFKLDMDGAKRLSKFCYECGSKYPVEHAKFCCECGTKRPFMNT